MCYSFKKNKKLVAVYFLKKLTVQKERKNNLSKGKIPAPPPHPWILHGLSLRPNILYIIVFHNNFGFSINNYT